MTKNSSFWQSVSELAAMRAQIPEERRALSGVRHALRRDVPVRQTKKSEGNRSGKGDEPIYRVTDKDEFAVDVASEINREAEDGLSPLTRFLDDMCAAAADNGSIAVERTDGEDEK